MDIWAVGIDNLSDLYPFNRTLMVMMLSIGCNRKLNKKDCVLGECSVIIMTSVKTSTEQGSHSAKQGKLQ